MAAKSPHTRQRGRETPGKNHLLDLTADNLCIVARENAGSTFLFRRGADGGDEVHLDGPLTFHSDPTLSYEAHEMLLQDSCRRLLLTPQKSHETLLRSDVETGKTLGQIFVSRNVADFALPLTSISANCKFNQLDASDVVHLQAIGNVDRNCLVNLSWDTRTPTKTVLCYDDVGKDSGTKTCHTYKGKTHFTCMATTRNGDTVVGEESGCVRFYNDTTKLAKSKSDQFADPVLAVDATNDGSLVVWTCDKFLSILPSTGLWDKKAKVGHAFVLKPDEEVLGAMGLTKDTLHFTKASFDCGPGVARDDPLATERFIHAAAGDVTFVWNLRHVQTWMKEQEEAETPTLLCPVPPRCVKHASHVVSHHGEHGNYQAVVMLEDQLNEMAL